MDDSKWTEGWMTGFMAAMVLMAQGGRGNDWLMLRDEYLGRAHPGKFAAETEQKEPSE